MMRAVLATARAWLPTVLWLCACLGAWYVPVRIIDTHLTKKWLVLDRDGIFRGRLGAGPYEGSLLYELDFPHIGCIPTDLAVDLTRGLRLDAATSEQALTALRKALDPDRVRSRVAGLSTSAEERLASHDAAAATRHLDQLKLLKGRDAPGGALRAWSELLGGVASSRESLQKTCRERKTDARACIALIQEALSARNFAATAEWVAILRAHEPATTARLAQKTLELIADDAAGQGNWEDALRVMRIELDLRPDDDASLDRALQLHSLHVGPAVTLSDVDARLSTLASEFSEFVSRPPLLDARAQLHLARGRLLRDAGKLGEAEKAYRAAGEHFSRSQSWRSEVALKELDAFRNPIIFDRCVFARNVDVKDGGGWSYGGVGVSFAIDTKVIVAVELSRRAAVDKRVKLKLEVIESGAEDNYFWQGVLREPLPRVATTIDAKGDGASLTRLMVHVPWVPRRAGRFIIEVSLDGRRVGRSSLNIVEDQQ